MARHSSRFHLPLDPADTLGETVGCRHTNPDICGKNMMPGVCAFARPDELCKAPPASWAKQFDKLKTQAEPKA